MIYNLEPQFDLFEEWEIKTKFTGKRPFRYIIRADNEAHARNIAYANSKKKVWLDEKRVLCIAIPETGSEMILGKEFTDPEF